MRRMFECSHFADYKGWSSEVQISSRPAISAAPASVNLATSGGRQTSRRRWRFITYEWWRRKQLTDVGEAELTPGQCRRIHHCRRRVYLPAPPAVATASNNAYQSLFVFLVYHRSTRISWYVFRLQNRVAPQSIIVPIPIRVVFIRVLLTQCWFIWMMAVIKPLHCWLDNSPKMCRLANIRLNKSDAALACFGLSWCYVLVQ